MTQLLVSAYKKSTLRGYSEIKVKDVLSLIKHDKKMFYRAIKLLSFHEGVSTIRKNMEEYQ